MRGMAVVTTPELDALLSQAERAVAALDHGAGSADLAGIARFLLRSEAIASSRIEGIAPSARQIAFAELAEHEEIRTFGAQAKLVARNMTIVREATTRLAEAETISLEAIDRLHRALLADEPRHHGVRAVQNWIGGSDWHPLDADFVPPSPERVPALLEDLVHYLSGATHAPIVQAALAHAQFETIHPFTDGNGRVGRALIHTVLARRGLTVNAVLPVSLVLATFRERYIDGLTAYRHSAEEGSPDAHAARCRWLEVFATAVLQAAGQASLLRDEIADMRLRWEHRVEAHRAAIGRQRQLRSDSAVVHILADLPSTPVLTANTVMRIHSISENAAMRALNELRDAEILETRSTGTRARAFVAREILDLVTITERQLASTRFDTRASAPIREVPALPEPRT
ncbi:Fic family protein [Agrococcus sp. Marseille-Q4369]|nr:Fic family protein [Agrococcus sp. Marseille-Q4369]